MADSDATPALALIAHSRGVRANSVRLSGTFSEMRRRVDDNRRTALQMTTAAVDRGLPVHPVMAARLQRLSAGVGRSPVIEQAKAALAEQYGISRSEAFELLAQLSSRSNRKLRDVAEHLLELQDGRSKSLSSPR